MMGREVDLIRDSLYSTYTALGIIGGVANS